MNHLRVYTDGASRGNPGYAAVGIRILVPPDKLIKEIKKFIGITTNNVAEYTALILGLQEALGLRAKRVEAYVDSELVVKQLLGQYKVSDDKLKPLFEIAKNLVTHFPEFSLRHVRRSENKEADRLANEALEEVLEFKN